MAVSDDYCAFVIDQLKSAGRVTERRMFGGVGLYLDGLFFALIDDDTLYFKTDDSNRVRYEKADSRPFCPDPREPGKTMAYWQVPAEVLENADDLAAWAHEAAAVARKAQSRSKPKPKPKLKSKR